MFWRRNKTNYRVKQVQSVIPGAQHLGENYYVVTFQNDFKIREQVRETIFLVGQHGFMFQGLESRIDGQSAPNVISLKAETISVYFIDPFPYYDKGIWVSGNGNIADLSLMSNNDLTLTSDRSLRASSQKTGLKTLLMILGRT
jgi:hypothetical protein